MKRLLLWVPLIAFVGIFALVALELHKPADRTVFSHMVGKPLPAFTLKPMLASKPGLDPSLYHDGTPRLINVFASWCVPCAAEAPQLMALKRGGVPIDAVAIRDTPQDVADFLQRNGDPYDRIGSDPRAQVQLDIGSSGVPETFVIDGEGTIVKQYVGPIRDDDIPEIIHALKDAR